MSNLSLEPQGDQQLSGDKQLLGPSQKIAWQNRRDQDGFMKVW